MPAGSIVKHLDVIEDVGTGELAGFIDALAHALLLQTAEERFGDRIDAPMSRSDYGVSQIREDQRIEFAHDIALQAALNLFR